MKTNALLKFSASAAILTIVTVGCKPADTRPATLSSSAVKGDRDVARAVARASAAIAKRDAVAAIAAAEAAVALAPRDAASRAMLGQAYLLDGRFASARTSFRDALALDPALGKAQLNLALVEAAMGRANVALPMLDELDGKVGAADRGLAYALAGDAARAVTILEAAARAEGADAKVRQNLALGYALAGRWNEAQSTAAQDLPADQLGRRMIEWVLFAQPRNSWDQVAGVLGVKPSYDPGQPVALALAPLPETVAPLAAPVAVAVAEPVEVVPAAMEARPPAIDMAEATEPPVEAAPAVPMLLQAAAVARPETPVAPPLIAAPPAPAKLMMKAVSPVRAARAPQANGRFVVQLGAYSSAARVEAAWNRIAARVAMVTDYAPSSGTFALQQTGTVYRLSLAGFATRDAATGVCERVRAKGGECFVRAAIDDRPMQWAGRKAKGEQLASR